MDDRALKVIGLLGAALTPAFFLINAMGWHLVAAVLLSFIVAVGVAALFIYEPSNAAWLEAHLGSRKYSPLYRVLMRSALRAVGPYFGVRVWKVRDRRSAGAVVKRTWNYALVDRALLLAVVYPLFLMLASWVITGGEVRLGVTPVLDPPESALSRCFLLLPLAILTVSISSRSWASAHPAQAARSVPDALFVLTLAITMGATLSGVIPFVAVAVAVAAAAAAAVDYLADRRRLKSAAAVVLIAPSAALVAAVMFLPWGDVDTLGRAIFLFLAVIPLTNALFDILSYGITFSLTQLGLRLRGGWAFALGVIDLAFAFLSLVGLATALVIFVTWMESVTKVDWIDLGGMLADLSNWERYGWVYLMMFSTLVPTLLHLAIACFALQSFVPRGAREASKSQIIAAVGPQGTLLKGALATLSLASLWWLSVALPFAGLFGLGWGLWNVAAPTFGAWYIQWLLNLSVSVGAV
ncbi:MAG: hypothetical protein AAGA15_04145 [Pseudomonadota bacterium]